VFRGDLVGGINDVSVEDDDNLGCPLGNALQRPPDSMGFRAGNHAD
jgi:hypothetical protein